MGLVVELREGDLASGCRLLQEPGQLAAIIMRPLLSGAPAEGLRPDRSGRLGRAALSTVIERHGAGHLRQEMEPAAGRYQRDTA